MKLYWLDNVQSSECALSTAETCSTGFDGVVISATMSYPFNSNCLSGLSCNCNGIPQKHFGNNTHSKTSFQCPTGQVISSSLVAVDMLWLKAEMLVGWDDDQVGPRRANKVASEGLFRM
jgi:hypothetical protein